LKQHKEIHQRENDRQRFVCPLEDCKKVYLYFSSLKKHLSKNHNEYYKTFFNEPSKGELQSFKRMTAQNYTDEETPRELSENLELSQLTEDKVKKESYNRKAKTEALK